MMCFRDMTFCSNTDECINSEDCYRAFDEAIKDRANLWAMGLGLDYTPVSLRDMKHSCDKFKSKDTK